MSTDPNPAPTDGNDGRTSPTVVAGGDGDGGTSPSPRRLGEARWWRLGAVSAVVVALLWGAGAWDGGLRLDGGDTVDESAVTSVTPTPASSGLVEAATLGCPGPELLGVEGDRGAPAQVVQVAAAVAPDRLGEPRTGDADADADGEGGATARLSTTAGSGEEADLLADGPAEITLEEAAGALVDATAGAAPALVGGQLGLSGDPGSRGLSLTACTAPAETVWLVGGGDTPGRTEQLVLTNPGDDAVTVEVDVWGADGPAVTTGASVVVPGRGRSVHLLDALTAQVGSPVVRVSSSGGPVVAHLGEHHRDGTTELGAEVVGPSVAPGTDLVVPAVAVGAPTTGGATSLTLRIAAPGEDAAVVDVTALTQDGEARLASRVTRVAAGHSIDVELDDLPEGVLALRLRSDTAVTAGARLTVAPSGEEPLQDGAAVTTGPDGAAVTTGADGAAVTAGPDGAAVTAGPDGAAVTAGPDDAALTAGPDGDDPPLTRPAGETAWVGATAPSPAPMGIALPARDGIPGSRATLAVSVVDATAVTVHLLDERGRVQREELGRLPNDTTVALPVPSGVRAVWVTSGGPAGVVASVVLEGEDRGGPYLAAATLPAVPWGGSSTEVTVLAP
ncbi:DUF5719 family protein [Ornithinimicrobium cerasi]|uniref:Secreted protein n=1 Tax=Ornithinimicrobium cerasi TaxID=2248773 RepID=A0A285VEE7_9MICO|nr:DUF5719 family protein [Ornithinimicrobium cerasi]SOC52485.1 hypothetical protein SAMN05421879_101601 [Ornithinimicrobium cerasi]